MEILREHSCVTHAYTSEYNQVANAILPLGRNTAAPSPLPGSTEVIDGVTIKNIKILNPRIMTPQASRDLIPA